MGLERRDGIGETEMCLPEPKKKKKKINFKKPSAWLRGLLARQLCAVQLELGCQGEDWICSVHALAASLLASQEGLRDGVCAENSPVPGNGVPWDGKCFPSPPFHPYLMGTELCWGVCKPCLGFRCVNAVHPAAGGVLSCSAPEEPCSGCFQILQHTKLSSLALPSWLFLQQLGPVFSCP